MFKHKSNTPCNNSLFSPLKIADMHKQMERLYEAASTLKAITGQSKLARALNTSPQTVKNWEARGVSKQGMLAAQRVIGCSAVWVETGNDQMRIGDGIDQAQIGVLAEFSIPLLSWVRAGDFCEAPGQFTLGDAEEMLPSPLFNTSKDTFALQVRGDSMDTPDGYREGEIVYINPDITPEPGRDVLAKTDSGMTLKRYKEDEDGPYLLQLNGNKIIRPEGRWHVCGVVVFAGRKR